MSANNDNLLDQWADNFLGVLVNPRATMKSLAESTGSGWSGIEGAAATLLLVSAVDGCLSAGTHFTWLTPLVVALGLVAGAVGWLLVVGPLAVAASAFNVSPQHIRASFVTTAWAFLPWLFAAPLQAIRNATGPAAIVLLLIPLGWVVYLQWLAVMEAYEIKGWQTLFLLVFLPQLTCFMCLWWFAQVFGTSLTWIFSGSASGIF